MHKLNLSLKRLLTPKSVAVIGGGVWGRSIIDQIQKIGFEGEIYPVHPKETQIAGLRVFKTISNIKGPIDAAFIGVNRNATIDVVEQLSKLGCGGAVCFASGFSEASQETADGTDLQNQLVYAAGNMPIIGPNCYGFINYLDKFCLWPDQHGGRPVDSGVAIVTQSSNIMLNLTMQARGLPIAYAMTAGNQAQIGLADIGRSVLKDRRVTALGLHIEGVGDLNAFQALAAYAKKLNKPIVAIKVGKSEQAQVAAISHTASIAGGDAGATALLERLGIARVDTLSEFVETLKLLHCTGPLAGNGIGSMSCSGGEASLMADLGVTRDLCFPPLDDKQKHGLRSALGSMVALANPLDYHTYVWGDGATMGRAFSSMMHGNDITIGTIVADFPRRDRCSDAAWDCVIEAAQIAIQNSGKPVALVGSLSENISEQVADSLIKRGIIPLCGMNEALIAIENAAKVHKAWSYDHLDIIHPNDALHDKMLTEAQSKVELAKFGLDVPRNIIRRFDELDAPLPFDFPVVIKAQGLAHKSDSGGVRINIGSQSELIQAAEEMAHKTYLIEEMIKGGICEVLVGVVCDPAHGFTITLAAGGILTEIMSDSTSMILPVNASMIDAALDRLKIAPLLRGYRGQSAVDRTALVNAVLAVQDYVIANKDYVGEIEINPLIATRHRAVAVDALVKIAKGD